MMKERTLKQSVRVGVLTAAFVGMSTASLLAAEFVSVVKDGVNLRSGPDTKYEVLFQLPKGYPLKVLSRKGKWIKVSDYENDRGWIYAGLVSKNRYVIVKVKEGNVRSGPGTNFDKIGKVSRDVILKSTERKGDWLKVVHPQLTGWVHKQLVWP
jgi:SH3-like domain-containing protein